MNDIPALLSYLDLATTGSRPANGAAAAGAGTPGRAPRSPGTGRRVIVPGGQPQLDRSTRSVGSTSTFWRRLGLAIRSSSRLHARSPSSRIGWWTVVSGGSHRLP